MRQADKEYKERLQMTVETLHHCSATWEQSVPIHETWQGKIVWEGRVEVFKITGNPKAACAYAWSHLTGENDDDERIVAVLAVPPITTPLAAVRASIVADVKKARK